MGEYDDELRDTLQSVFRYDKDRFKNEKRYDDRQMEVKSWRDIEKEEKRSARLALLEDAQEMANGAADLTGNGWEMGILYSLLISWFGNKTVNITLY